MKQAAQINRLIISPEAIFDYEEDMNLGVLHKGDIKQQLIEHIDNITKSGEFCRYFRVKYYDEQADKMLMLFVYRGESFGTMCIWRLSGICVAEHWDEDLEDEGLIRSWLNEKIVNLPEKEDWVENYRTKQKEQEDYQKEFDKERIK